MKSHSEEFETVFETQYREHRELEEMRERNQYWGKPKPEVAPKVAEPRPILTARKYVRRDEVQIVLAPVKQPRAERSWSMLLYHDQFKRNNGNRWIRPKPSCP